MHMAVGQSKHSNINCRGFWRLVPRHQLSAETACIHALIYYYTPLPLNLANNVTTKPRDIRQLASECNQIMAGVYYVVTLAT